MKNSETPENEAVRTEETTGEDAISGDGTPDAGRSAAPDDGARQIDFEEVKQHLHPVKDPEINLSIVELGLVYSHEWNPETGKLKILMTLTSQMCPLGPEILNGVQIAAQQIPGVREVEVELVWNPPWDPRTHCSEDAKAMLGIWD